MPECDDCGDRMSRNDETTKIIEWVCPNCHATDVQLKDE